MSSTRIVLIFLTACLLPMVTNAQTLGEVLRAVQHRQQLLIDNQSAFAALGGTGTSARVLVNWGLGNSYPTDAQVDALSVATKLSLLQQAKKDVDILYGSNIPTGDNGHFSESIYFRDKRMLGDGVGILKNPSDHEYDERLSLSSYNQSLSILAQRVSRLGAVDWPVQWLGFQGDNDSFFEFPFVAMISDSSEGDWYRRGIYIGQSLADEPSSIAAASFPGDINIFSSFNYYITAVSEPGPYSSRGDALYDPSNQVYSGIKNASQLNVSQLPNIFFDTSSTINYSLVQDPLYPNPAYQLHFRGQKKDIAPFNDVWNGEEYVDGLFLPDGITFTGVYYPQFGAEFASSVVTGTANALPEFTKRLSIIPKLENGELQVALGVDPVDECALTWSFPSTIGQSISDTLGSSTSSHEGALSAHKCLTVQGCGNWDAVYSGRDMDREPQIEWPEPNGTKIRRF